MAFGVVVLASPRQDTVVFANHPKHFERGKSFSSPSHIPTSFAMMNDASSKTFHEHEKVPHAVQCVKSQALLSSSTFSFPALGEKKKGKKEKIKEKQRPFTFPWTQRK